MTRKSPHFIRLDSGLTLREALTAWRRFDSAALDARILHIQRLAVRQHITPAQWEIVDRMRERLVALRADEPWRTPRHYAAPAAPAAAPEIIRPIQPPSPYGRKEPPMRRAQLSDL